MSRLPIRVRLALVFALVMAVVLAAVGAVLYVRLGDTLDERIADSLEARAAALAETLDATSGAVVPDDGVAQVLEENGSVASASVGAPADSLLPAAALTSATSAATFVDVEVDDVDLRLLGLPAGDRVVVVGEPLDDRDEALDGLLAQLALVLPLALLASSATGYLVAGAALRPVEAMRRRAAEISAETPDTRLPIPRADDEVARLGRTLNEMLDRLEGALERERRFVADASHELRTPLATLRAELELAGRRSRTHEELESVLASATEDVERLVGLAEDLLVLARADDGALVLRREHIVASDLLGAVATRSAARARAAGRAIEISSADGTVLTGDLAQLERALENLVDNALIHGSGKVRIEARANDGVVTVSVSDEGAGFPAAFLPHAFERFARADAARSGGGAGLGLAIADAIVRAHGGTAAAANKPDRGAIVALTLPA